jgi:hypothetical protein
VFNSARLVRQGEELEPFQPGKPEADSAGGDGGGVVGAAPALAVRPA